MEENEELDKEAKMLDLINKVQMFQIAGSKVNQMLMERKKDPVFNLQFTETFNVPESEMGSNAGDRIVESRGIESALSGRKKDLSLSLPQ